MVYIKKFLGFPNFNKFDLIKQIFFANLYTLAYPFKVTFALTYRCNFLCKYCNIWMRPKKNELTFDKIKSILDSLINLRWLHLTGGELFLREDIEEILNFLIEKRKLAILTFPTNGFYTEKIFNIVKYLSRKLRGIRLLITCSIDGTEKLHDRLKGVEGAYEKCIKTFMKLRTINKINTFLGFTVSRDNYLDLPFLLTDLTERIPSFSFNELHFNFAERSSFYYTNTSMNPSEELINNEIYAFIEKMRRKYRERKIRLKNFLENNYFKLMELYLKNKISPTRCTALNGSCFIDPYGELYPCINYEVEIGNLDSANYNFDLFWELSLEKRRKIRNLINDKKCPGCWTSCEAYPSILSSIFKQNF